MTLDEYVSSRPVVSTAFEAFDVQLAGETSFRVRRLEQAGKQISGKVRFPEDIVFRLTLPGLHNVQNALAALTAASLVGVDAATIQHTLAGFNGIRRRYEIRHNGSLAVDGRTVDVILVDDYAHHPTAIEATLTATRQRYPDRRLIAVYQPHMYSRTKTFFDQFLTAFNEADVTIIADIFPARERDTGLISSRELVKAMRSQPFVIESGKQVLSGGNMRETTELVLQTLRSGDVVLIMGAGDIYTLTETLLSSIEDK